MSTENYKIAHRASRQLRQAAGVLESILTTKDAESLDPNRVRVTETVADYRRTADALDGVAAILKPTPGLIAWNKGTAEAAKNYHPFSNGMPKNF